MNKFLNKINQGDCLALMQDLPDNCVDMVFADLPYGVTKCDWDTRIDLPTLWEQLKRIVKPRAPIIMTATQPFTTDLIMSNRKWFRYEWIWDKRSPSSPSLAKKQPLRVHETILIFCEKSPVYYPILDPKSLTGAIKKRRFKKTNSKVIGCTTGLENQNTGYPKSILRFTRPSNWVEGERFHPSQKPTQLLKYLIQTYTNPNEIVLDCVIGSGTTPVAAIETGRQFCGFELDKEYCDIANKRVKRARMQRPLF